LLRLAEPEPPAVFAPVPEPTPPSEAVPAWVAGADVRPDRVHIERYPDLSAGEPHAGLAHRHLVADVRTASLAQMGAAKIVVTDHRAAGSLRRWAERAPAQLDPWPQASMLATVVDQWSCAIWTGAGVLLLTADELIDPVLLASMAYARPAGTGQVPSRDRLHLAGRSIGVAVEAG
jgi:hypothetical protein